MPAPGCPSNSEFTLDLANPVLALAVLPQQLFVSQYPVSTPVPSSLFTAGDWVSVTRTPKEISIVASKEAIEASGIGKTEHTGGPWTALRVKGPLEHHMVGVLSAITDVLRDAKISIFAISTWDTDYILVTSETLDQARKALGDAGWQFGEWSADM